MTHPVPITWVARENVPPTDAVTRRVDGVPSITIAVSSKTEPPFVALKRLVVLKKVSIWICARAAGSRASSTRAAESGRTGMARRMCLP